MVGFILQTKKQAQKDLQLSSKDHASCVWGWISQATHPLSLVFLSRQTLPSVQHPWIFKGSKRGTEKIVPVNTLLMRISSKGGIVTLSSVPTFLSQLRRVCIPRILSVMMLPGSHLQPLSLTTQVSGVCKAAGGQEKTGATLRVKLGKSIHLNYEG